MSLATVMSRASVGIEAPPVQVEVHITGGLPKFAIVGLPEATVRESKDRVRSAIINSRFEFPKRRITVNLAPAELPKDGSRFDLPIAAGILAATGQLCHDRLHEHELIGELALDGAREREEDVAAADLAPHPLDAVVDDRGRGPARRATADVVHEPTQNTRALATRVRLRNFPVCFAIGVGEWSSRPLYVRRDSRFAGEVDLEAIHISCASSLPTLPLR